MAAKLLSLYLLVVASLELARAGTSTSWRLNRLVRWRADCICDTAPLIPRQSSVVQFSARQLNVSDVLSLVRYAPNIHLT